MYSFCYSYGDCEKTYFVNTDNKKRAISILNTKYRLNAKENDLKEINLKNDESIELQ